MNYVVKTSERAIADLLDIRNWIAGEADHLTAHNFIGRIESQIATLANFPNRGTPRDALRPGTRTLSFERNFLIFYRVETNLVLIDRVVSGRRDLSALS